MEITKEMVTAWKNDPVTKAVLNAILEEYEEAKEYLASGATLEEREATGQAVGRCQAYWHCQTIFEDVRTIDSEESEL